MQEGYGACLLQKPQLLAEMITAAKSRVSNMEDFTVSIKIRLHDNIRYVLCLFFLLLFAAFLPNIVKYIKVKWTMPQYGARGGCSFPSQWP